MNRRLIVFSILLAALLPRAALAQDPREAGSYAEMRAYLGELYEQQKYAEGAALLERVLDRFPDQVLANTYNLAIMRALAGDPGGGVEALEEGLRRGVFYGIWDFDGEILAPLKTHARFADFWQRNLARLEAAQSQATMQMELVLPEGYDAAQAYPLFVALHGGGESLAAFKPNWESPRLRAEFITLYVQSSQVANMRGFHWQEEALTRRDLTAAYAQAVAQHRIDSDRVLVGGFSSGGYAALLASFHEILPVRGFVALCPPVPDSITDAEIGAAAARGLRGSLLTTELDQRLAAQRELADRWAALGLAGEFVVSPNTGHWYPDDFPAQLDLAIDRILTAAPPAAGQASAGTEMQTLRLGEQLIIVSDGGMGTQVAVNARNGIVVFDSGWCTRIAAALRRQIEAEFGRRDFAAVVLTNQRLDYVGGSKAYAGTEIIAHEQVRAVLARQQADLQPHLQPLIDMWRWKEGASRERLPSHAPGSQEARVEENWLHTCKQMADDLSEDYELLLPTRTFADRLSLDLGDMTLELVDFGVGARGETGIVARIPQLKLVLFGRLLFHEQHLLPYLNAGPWQDLRIPHTLRVLDELLADEANIETVIVTSGPWPLAEIKARRRYMGELWDAVGAAVKQGTSLAELQQALNLDGPFAYIKDWPVWQNQGAEWCTREHLENVARFWGQFQAYAARDVFQACRESGTEAALATYAKCASASGGEPIVDERSLDALVETLFGQGYLAAAQAVAGLNAERFPDSWRVHSRLGEGLLLRGDRAGALAAFRKALALDPENAALRRRLEQLETR